jgi:hypothetical protein
LDLREHKTLLILLFAVVLNVAVFVLLEHLNTFVHGDMYDYGLVFSYEWAEGVWHYNLSCWTFIIGATALTVFAMVPHYMIDTELVPSYFLVIIGFLLPALACVYEGLSIFYLSQIDFIVRNSFFGFGIPSSFDWSVTYDPIIGAAYSLMTISIVALIIPAVRALGILKIDISNEAD